MPEPVDPQAFVMLVEMTIDNMYELEAIGKLLEHKGVLTKQEILALAKDLKQKTPSADTHAASTTDNPELPRFTDTENAVIEQIMEVILQSGLSSHQAKALLERTITLLKWGEKTAPKTTH
jgi:hypothetical protein